MHLCIYIFIYLFIRNLEKDRASIFRLGRQIVSYPKMSFSRFLSLSSPAEESFSRFVTAHSTTPRLDSTAVVCYNQQVSSKSVFKKIFPSNSGRNFINLSENPFFFVFRPAIFSDVRYNDDALATRVCFWVDACIYIRVCVSVSQVSN